VHPDYLNAMIDRLQDSHGSVERYLHERLGIDQAHIQRLRAHLLE
jgi:hypothetical protein